VNKVPCEDLHGYTFIPELMNGQRTKAFHELLQLKNLCMFPESHIKHMQRDDSQNVQNSLVLKSFLKNGKVWHV
jgi:hypothetical protein